MRYAINLCDLTKEEFRDPLKPPTLLLQRIMTTEVVQVRGTRWDGDAVLVKEAVPDEQMQAILTIIRKGAGNLTANNKARLRVYQSKTGKGGWKRI